MRIIDVPISRRCPATKRPSIGYANNAAFGHMQPEENNIKNLEEKAKATGNRKKRETLKMNFSKDKKTRRKNKKTTNLGCGEDRTQKLRYVVQAMCTNMQGGAEEKNRKWKKAEVLPSIASSD